MINARTHYWFTVPVARARMEEIIRRAKGFYKILEVGCNEGFLSKALLEDGHHVTSVDNDPKMLRIAKDLFNIEGIEADVEDLPFLDNEFDLVIGAELLEHLSNPGKGLSELFRVSKGRVIISLPIGRYWLGEPTHKWQIDATAIEHDQGLLDQLVKKGLVLEFNKRRE